MLREVEVMMIFNLIEKRNLKERLFLFLLDRQNKFQRLIVSQVKDPA
jgi:hypothetical protein